MKSRYVALIIIVLIAGALFYFTQSNSGSDQTEIKQSLDTEQNTKTEEGGTNDTNALSTRYVDYSQDSFTKASAGSGKSVFFFAALKWCPSCQAADKDFKANFSKVPEDVTILKVDYDTAKDMKQKYAITMQDTFVQVDSNGKEITRWNSGGQGTSALLANLK